MDFRLSKEEELLQKKVRAIAEEYIRPMAAEIDERDDPSWDLVRKLAGEGIFAVVVPKKYGGMTEQVRASFVCIVREELSRVSSNADFMFAMQGLAGYPIILGGTEELKEKYLPSLVKGEKLGAYALTEPHAGSDVANIHTEARRDGDQYVLNGTKLFISNAAYAGIVTLFAKTDMDKGTRGISVFVVDGGTSGLTCTRTQEVIAPHALGELKFEDCRIPASNLVGEVDKGFKLAMMTFDVYRTSVGACALGLAQAAYDLAIAYANQRHSFGKPLGEHQGIQFKIADMATELDAARLLVYRAAWLKDQGASRVTKEASMAKLFATEAANRIVDHSLQIHGGRGVVKGYEIERLFRQARACRIYEGASEIQRIVIARMALS